MRNGPIFRIFDKKANRHMAPGGHTLTHYGCLVSPIGDRCDHLVVEMASPTLDHNGNFIFEGDIVRTQMTDWEEGLIDEFWEVIFIRDKYFSDNGFLLKSLKDGRVEEISRKLEVVGNKWTWERLENSL